MRTDVAASEVRILWHLWCSSANLLHLLIASSTISVVNCVYVIAPGIRLVQLGVSFVLVKGLTHDTRFLCLIV